MIDIIIPVLNEEEILKERKDYYQALAQKARVFFVDGGSADRTIEVAKNYGTVISSKKGRSRQKNVGALKAKSEYLLFLHVDSFVSDDAINQIPKILDYEAGAGCFTMKIDDEKKIFRVYEKIVNARASRWGIIDGDLGTFVRRDVFERVGRFDDLPIMEDIVFSRKIRKTVKIKALPQTILVSARKWHEKGFVKTFGCYTLAYLQLWTGIQFFKNADENI